MMKNLTKQQQIYLAGGVALVIVFIIAAALIAQFSRGGCEKRAVVVQGADMFPAYKEGQTLHFRVRGAEGACDVADGLNVGDVVLFQTAQEDRQIPLFVKATPGATLALKENEEGRSAILVNGEQAVNSQKQPYLLSSAKAQMIALYIDSYKGVVPGGAYLLLGDNPEGGYDSTRLGLLDKQDFVGVLTGAARN